MITFDSSPTIYWLAGYVLAGIVIIASGWRKVPDRLFLLLCLTLFVFMRLPAIVFNRELNPDESQMLSHAITLFQDPVYWRSVDGTTIGPLDNYLLVIPRILGFQINYTSGRLMGMLCSAGALTFLFLSLKNWFSGGRRWAFAATVIMLAFTQELDFVHYSSEQLPVFMLSACVWLFSRLSIQKKLSPRALFVLGLVAGASPFAKLQVVPMALVIVAGACWLCFVHFRKNKNLTHVFSLLAGGLAFPLVVLAWTFTFGVFRDLIDFYLLGNVIYAGGKGFWSIPSQFALILRRSTDFQIYSMVLLVPIIAGLIRIVTIFRRKEEQYPVPVTLGLLLLATIYAVTKSGNDFVHYLNFCFIPWTLLAAYGFAKPGKWHLAFPAIVLACFITCDAFLFRKEHRLNDFPSTGARGLGESEVVKAARKFIRKGDYMTVWGWQCIYYVEAQLAQGTAENHSERSIFSHPLRDTYRQRYLSDVERTRPAVILDAVGKNSFWVQDRPTQDLRCFPGLFSYVSKNYSLAGDYDGTRLYVRNDRLKL
ncbi:hypothetical protein [Dyadobacter sandarakinus]|uniref:Glycosyltransferase RgtA/B/C/D-like domain-containing protein n=1 Tax=Dyadobacter sandarakinus TaxID=2747268 RepID=A0ABX7I9L3_9BACT|nr:hypothetical protein [Dyadobacter sandarakinus]QRR02801.1 hypothetical protein HWI92_18715 [Dyadobacter sandarakinus]